MEEWNSIDFELFPEALQWLSGQGDGVHTHTHTHCKRFKSERIMTLLVKLSLIL